MINKASVDDIIINIKVFITQAGFLAHLLDMYFYYIFFYDKHYT